MNRRHILLLGVIAAAALLFFALTNPDDPEEYAEHDAYLDSAGRPAVLVCHWQHDKMAQPPVFAIRPDAQGIIPTEGPGFVQLGVTSPPMTQQVSRKTAEALKSSTPTPTLTTVTATATASPIPMTATPSPTPLPPLTVPPSVPITAAPV